MNKMIIFLVIAFLLIIPSFSSKTIDVTDDGSLYGNIQPQSVYYNGNIYTVFGRYVNSDDNIDTIISKYSVNDNEVCQEVVVGYGIGDSHGAPCITIDDRGYIHVFYGSHCFELLYQRSELPEDISTMVESSIIVYQKIMKTMVYSCIGHST